MREVLGYVLFAIIGVAWLIVAAMDGQDRRDARLAQNKAKPTPVRVDTVIQTREVVRYQWPTPIGKSQVLTALDYDCRVHGWRIVSYAPLIPEQGKGWILHVEPDSARNWR